MPENRKSVDPVYSSKVLEADITATDIDFDALGHALHGFQGKVDKKPKTAAIVLAGGRGERFGSQLGKQLFELAGRPILTWAIEAFDVVGDVGCIVVVAPEERHQEYYERAIEPYGFVTPIVMAPSGPSRQESAFSGLEYVPDNYEYVVLHDGARPLVSSALIGHTINVLKGTLDADGAIVANPVYDTLKVVDGDTIVGTPDRTAFWHAQTPQVFRAGIYRRAHAAAFRDGFVGTDDSSLIERMGGRVLVVEGKRDNLKITVPEDYLMLLSAARSLYLKVESAREGGSASAELTFDDVMNAH